MTIDAEDLLAGPRGRRLCLEYALACVEFASAMSARDAASVVFRAVQAFEGGGVVSFTRSAVAGSGAVVPPPHPPADAAAALASIELHGPTSAMLRDALAASVDRAMYWQPPDGADVLCAAEEVVSALRPVAARIADAPGSQWWATGVATDDQWTVPWDGGGRLSPDVDGELQLWREQTLADDARARAERPDDPAAPWGGQWWSIPPHRLVRTTRSLAGDGPAGLWFVEDFFGGDEAVATPVDAYPARVIEIDGSEDWAQLCRRHPLDVSASRRQDWYSVTGRDGTWVIPDWAAVAAEADGVHLTVRGYLTAATTLIDVGEGSASVLAGWNPDETFWFRGVAARPADQERWIRDDGVWSRVAE